MELRKSKRPEEKSAGDVAGSANLEAWQLIAESKFEEGGEDILGALRREFPGEPSDEDTRQRCQKKWEQFVQERRIKFGTILKSDNVSVLLGAGASSHAGGVLLSTIPLSIERALLEAGSQNDQVAPWLQLFYTTIYRIASNKDDVPLDPRAVLKRRKAVLENTLTPRLQVNLERLLSMLFCWQAALVKPSWRIHLSDQPPMEIQRENLDQLIAQTKKALIRQCILPNETAIEDEEIKRNPLRVHRMFLRKLLTRPLNLKRVNVFTLNYDTLVEQAADAEGIVAQDGFIGMLCRIFRPESYDQDLYFPAETTEGRVHRLDRVIHLYKLHGSIGWRGSESKEDNPYGVVSISAHDHSNDSALIYPTPQKHGDVLGMPYAELFRRFAWAVVRPQSVLIVIGYGFADDHVVSIIRQAITVPSFRLIIVDPNPQSQVVAKLREQKDQRIWIISGTHLGKFGGFVDQVLPDLREEEINKKAMQTYRVLSPKSLAAEVESGEGSHGE